MQLPENADRVGRWEYYDALVNRAQHALRNLAISVLIASGCKTGAMGPSRGNSTTLTLGKTGTRQQATASADSVHSLPRMCRIGMFNVENAGTDVGSVNNAWDCRRRLTTELVTARLRRSGVESHVPELIQELMERAVDRRSIFVAVA